jgi:hypothetical protein
VECPGCGWKSKPNLVHLTEFELRGHLEDCHTPDRECAFCRAEFQSFEALEEHVPQCPMFTRREKNMALSWSARKAKLPGGAPLLKGSDLPKSTSFIKVKIKAVRETPDGFGSPFVIDINNVTTIEKDSNGDFVVKSAVALNRSSCNWLADKYGDDFDDLVGKTIVLYVVQVTNPKTKKLVRSLTAVEPE